MVATFVPNSYSTPNAFADKLMCLVTPQEWVVLSFVCRHILGWQDTVSSRQKSISISMIEKGYSTQSGEKYNGCGLSKPTIMAALDNLSKYKILEKIGEPTAKGQRWHIPTDDSSVDYSGLQSRINETHNKVQAWTVDARKKAVEKKKVVKQSDQRSNDLTSGQTVRPEVVKQSDQIRSNGLTESKPYTKPLTKPDSATALSLVAKTEPEPSTQIGQNGLLPLEVEPITKVSRLKLVDPTTLPALPTGYHYEVTPSTAYQIACIVPDGKKESIGHCHPREYPQDLSVVGLGTEAKVSLCVTCDAALKEIQNVPPTPKKVKAPQDHIAPIDAFINAFGKDTLPPDFALGSFAKLSKRMYEGGVTPETMTCAGSLYRAWYDAVRTKPVLTWSVAEVTIATRVAYALCQRGATADQIKALIKDTQRDDFWRGKCISFEYAADHIQIKEKGKTEWKRVEIAPGVTKLKAVAS